MLKPTGYGRQTLLSLGLLGLIVADAVAAKPTYTYVPIGTLGGATSTAQGINDARDVVGVSDLADGTSAAFLYTAANGLRNLNGITDSVLDFPNQLRFGPDRNNDGIQDLYVVSQGFYEGNGARLDVFDGVDGRFVQNLVPPGSGGMVSTAWMSFAPDGDVLIGTGPTNTTRNRVARFDGATGTYLGDFVTLGDNGGLANAQGMEFGPDLNGDSIAEFFVSSTQTNEVLVYDGATGGFLDVFAQVYPPSETEFLAGDIRFRDIDNDGIAELLVSTRADRSVLAFSSIDGSFIREFVAPHPNVTGPLLQFTFGPDGHLYAPILVTGSEANSVKICRFDGTTGAYLGDFVPLNSGGIADPSFPFIEFDTVGSLYVSSTTTNQVMKFQGPAGASPGAFVEIFVTGTGFLFPSANDINNAGQIVGSGYPRGRRNDLSKVAAYRYSPPAPGEEVGQAIDLNLPGATFEAATAINDSGDVAGHFRSPTDNKIHAFLWSASTGTAVDLGMLSGQDTYVTGLTNRSGGHVQISGYANTSSGIRGWRYNSATGVKQNLGLISGSSGSSRAWDINNSGTVVGAASVSNKQHAFTRTLSGSMVDLGTLGGNNSYGTAINDAGTVVGTADTTTKSSTNRHQAFMRTSTDGMFKLEPQITNLPGAMQFKIRPNRINTTGAVCGPGEADPAGTAFILVPQ